MQAVGLGFAGDWEVGQVGHMPLPHAVLRLFSFSGVMRALRASFIGERMIRHP